MPLCGQHASYTRRCFANSIVFEDERGFTHMMLGPWTRVESADPGGEAPDGDGACSLDNKSVAGGRKQNRGALRAREHVQGCCHGDVAAGDGQRGQGWRAGKKGETKMNEWNALPGGAQKRE